MKLNQKGFSLIEGIAIGVFVLGIGSFAVFRITQNGNSEPDTTSLSAPTEESEVAESIASEQEEIETKSDTPSDEPIDVTKQTTQIADNSSSTEEVDSNLTINGNVRTYDVDMQELVESPYVNYKVVNAEYINLESDFTDYELKDPTANLLMVNVFVENPSDQTIVYTKEFNLVTSTGGIIPVITDYSKQGQFPDSFQLASGGAASYFMLFETSLGAKEVRWSPLLSNEIIETYRFNSTLLFEG